jgi:fluoride exporter
MQWLAVAIGGALGAMGRYAVVAYAFPVLSNRFPLGTLVANVAGSFLLGVCYVLIVDKGLLNPQWRLVLMTGFLGAFTTFSAFALESVQLWHYGHGLLAVSYALFSTLCCILAVAVALALTARLIG